MFLLRPLEYELLPARDAEMFCRPFLKQLEPPIRPTRWTETRRSEAIERDVEADMNNIRADQIVNGRAAILV